MEYLQSEGKFVQHRVIAPVIFSVVIPVVFLDIWIEIYHRVTFPVYGIPYIKRSRYIQIDRQKLAYLTQWQKVCCMYCSYVGGVVNYWSKIIGETEKYWCGIKHKENPGYNTPSHHGEFAEYDNEEDFNEKYCKLKT